MNNFSQKVLSITRGISQPRFLLHSGKGDRFSFLGIGKKHEIILDGKEKDICKKLRNFWEQHGQEKVLDYSNSPLQGGVFVFLSYDLLENFEPSIQLKHSHQHIPKIYAIVPEDLIIFDHEKEEVIGTVNLEEKNEEFEIKEHEWKITISKDEYKKNIDIIKDEIVKGNTFQVNYSQRFIAKQQSPSWDIFQNLASINPTPFSAFAETPFGEIISGSPERLVSLKNNVLETKPIAGTRKRDKMRDDELMFELHSNKKEQAEHAMIVDLERNDMGRVCEFGSVHVPEFGYIEKYSHVQHLVSTIHGNLAKDKNFADVIQAMHPGGTITGCPKVETCKIINDLELFDRGIYTGAIGYINHEGNMDLNILIRTIYAHNGKLETQAGGGIILDSNPEREYKETLHKAQAQFAATNGIIK